LLDTGFAYAEVSILRPGERAPFGVVVVDPPVRYHRSILTGGVFHATRSAAGRGNASFKYHAVVGGSELALYHGRGAEYRG
jgi:hypothetical protein